MDILLSMFFSCNLLFFFYALFHALDTVSSSQFLSDGNTLISEAGNFELGFFSPGSPMNRYLGIWYKKIPDKTVVWVANRLNPINGSSGLLMINSMGRLVLTSQNKSEVWSANLTKAAVQTPVVLQLLDSGNLVLRKEHDDNPGTYFWQSFDYPSDTLLPGMKLGWDLKTGLERRVTSWKSSDDPYPGDFIWGMELQDNPEGIMWKGSKKFCSSGPWNGRGFSGAPELRPNPFFKYSFVSNDEELYVSYSMTDNSVMARVVMNQTNYLRQRYIWSETTRSWMEYGNVPRDDCDNYGFCGAYGVCIIGQSPICQCFQRFKYRLGNMDWRQGCVRSKSLNYSKTDGFIKYDNIKLPDATNSWVNESMNLKECQDKCLENSSCMAYTNSDISGGGSGCAMWFGDLIDMRLFQDGGQDLYIRMSASELATNRKRKKKILVIILSTIAVVVLVLVLIVGYYIHKTRRNLAEKIKDQKKEDLELPMFELDTIANATNNFSMNNKLGQGGFGPVYKGTLVDGQEIAVKRLSKISGQGLDELKNEVILIAKLQHRNLVRLLGCCMQGEEKLLIYEFMPNKSLDYFIFEEKRNKLLDWSKRFNIICGIARGILYLHQDSRLRIIHRDLKASNVLLDLEMNPKISDFGLARTFGADQTEGNTKRVVGTYGYMAPEYAADGLFSIKSDVFSFGILMLEIVSGKKNRGFFNSDHSNLTGQAWKLWKERKPLELIHPFLAESAKLSDMTRCIHISLLCVQQYSQDRPSMSSVVLMLGSENTLPEPKQPGFLLDRNALDLYSSSSKTGPSPSNELTISMLDPR